MGKLYSEVFAMDKFLPFIDLFRELDAKASAALIIMEAFSQHQKSPATDPLIRSGMMYLCKVSHQRLLYEVLSPIAAGYILYFDIGKLVASVSFRLASGTTNVFIQFSVYP